MKQKVKVFSYSEAHSLEQEINDWMDGQIKKCGLLHINTIEYSISAVQLYAERYRTIHSALIYYTTNE